MRRFFIEREYRCPCLDSETWEKARTLLDHRNLRALSQSHHEARG